MSTECLIHGEKCLHCRVACEVEKAELERRVGGLVIARDTLRKMAENNFNRAWTAEAEVKLFREGLEIVMQNCSCSIKERNSGHLIGCFVPHVESLLSPAPAEKGNENV